MTMQLRLGALAWLPALVAGVPEFRVNLDLPPRQRWVRVAKYYREEILAMADTIGPIIDKSVGSERDAWMKVAHFDPEYEEEMRGFVDAIDHPKCTYDGLRLNLFLYEMASPTYCSGMLWAMKNGTVVHGRNMDYAFHWKMPDGRTLNWPDVTFEAIFERAGKPLMKATMWPGGVGFHTAMRFNGWSFEQNTRFYDNEPRLNLKALQMGAEPYQHVARRTMEKTGDFKEAVKRMALARYSAPSYFVMSGARPGEGAVLTVERLNAKGTPRVHVRTISTSGQGWYLLQTNDDLTASPIDERRPLATVQMALAKQDMISTQHMMEFMHTPPLYNEKTVFSTVMVPATGYYKTTLFGEAPGQIDLRVLGRGDPADDREDPIVRQYLRGLRKHTQ